MKQGMRRTRLLKSIGVNALAWLLSLLLLAPLLLILINSLKDSTAGLRNVLEYISSLSLPFLLMANFARILNNTDGFKKQLLRNGGATAAIFLVFLLFFNRYVVGTVGLLLKDSTDAYPLVMTSFYGVNPRGFFAFNIFVDLFLCTLVMYFMNARPTKVFTGKKIYIFRAFTILPIAYEVVSIILKGRAAAGSILIPAWLFPLLTVKPPMTSVER